MTDDGKTNGSGPQQSGDVKVAGARGRKRRRVKAMSLADRRRRMREAVRDLPDEEPSKLTSEDVETLREAGLEEVAEVAEIYVSSTRCTENAQEPHRVHG